MFLKLINSFFNTRGPSVGCGSWSKIKRFSRFNQ